jgi:hypothetical protein
VTAEPADTPGAGSHTQPDPVLPAFGDRCLTEVLPALLAQVHGRRQAGDRELPDWFPPAVGEARQIVLLVLDGLGSEQLAARRAIAPLLGAAPGVTITSVAPSTTAVALTSLATGLPPAVHGTVGYRVAVGDDVLNVLLWRLGGADARRTVRPRRFQPFSTLGGEELHTPVVSRFEYGTTGFTASHLGDAALHGWHTPAGLAVEVRRLVDDGAPFVYAYYDGVDRTAHACGLDEHYDAELRAVDRMVGDLLDALPSGAALVVTADHGQVEVGRSVEVLDGSIMEDVVLLSGEGRFRWLHARAGAAGDLAARAREEYADVAWVKTVDQVVGEGWLGGVPQPEIASRLGDVALVPFAPTAFLDPADTGEQRLVCRHGSLTADEMYVPLLAWTACGG